MELSRKDFEILDALDNHEIETQRQLAAYADISLGQVNYILKGLLEKGLVKIGKFRKNPNKIKYAYLLTPKGIETKSRLAVKYVIRRLNKYQRLHKRMEDRLAAIEAKGARRILFIGPDIVLEFVNSIITQKRIQLNLVGHHNNWEALKRINPEIFDIVLMFDEGAEGYKQMHTLTGIPKNQIVPLWWVFGSIG